MAWSSLSPELHTTILQHVCAPDYQLIAGLRLVSRSFRQLLSTDAFWQINPKDCSYLLERPNVLRSLMVANLKAAVFYLPTQLLHESFPSLLEVEVS